MVETVVRGKFVPKKRIIKDIHIVDIGEQTGYRFIGETQFQFGFVHEWDVGPYTSITEGLADFNANNC